MLFTGTLAATSTEEPGISGAPGSRPRRDSPLDWQRDTVALGEAGQIQPAAAAKEAQSDRVAEGAALATRLPAWDGPLTGEQGESTGRAWSAPGSAAVTSSASSFSSLAMACRDFWRRFAGGS